ncbi:MAG: hypothetical protein JNJ54_24120 [Myxococcaceae bacterium]|nr:hypothetical protein [Myxococcaceae bacterium]
MTSVVELLDFPEGTRTARGALQRYARFPLDDGFELSPTGTVRVPGVPDGAGWQLVLERATPRFIGGQQARLESLSPTVFRVQMGPLFVLFRVVSAQTPSLAWPAALDGQLGEVAPGVTGLDVLGDALLERQHPLGARLRGLAGQWTEDEWMGELPLLEQDARLDLTLARGVAVSAAVRSLRGLDRVSAHVVTHLVQQVDLLAWSDEAPTKDSITAALDVLLARRLPWLATLRVHGLKPAVGDALERTWRQGRWSALVSRGCVLETPRPAPLVLKTSSRVDPVPDRGFMQVGEGSPLCFVRLRHATPELTIARPSFTLGTRTRSRSAALQSPWVVPLKPGDAFVIDERAYTIDLA